MFEHSSKIDYELAMQLRKRFEVFESFTSRTCLVVEQRDNVTAQCSSCNSLSNGIHEHVFIFVMVKIHYLDPDSGHKILIVIDNNASELHHPVDIDTNTWANKSIGALGALITFDATPKWMLPYSKPRFWINNVKYVYKPWCDSVFPCIHVCIGMKIHQYDRYIVHCSGRDLNRIHCIRNCTNPLKNLGNLTHKEIKRKRRIKYRAHLIGFPN